MELIYTTGSFHVRSLGGGDTFTHTHIKTKQIEETRQMLACGQHIPGLINLFSHYILH